MEHEQDETAARELKAELRQLADTILDLEARGQLLSDAPRLLKMLGDARSRVFAYEVRFIRTTGAGAAQPADQPESRRVVEEAMQREHEVEQEWLKPWERRGEAEL